MQTQAQYAQSDAAELAFKRHILEKSEGFACEPTADLFRVNLLAQMLDRYDALRAKGMGEAACQSRVLFEFDVAAMMREQGFEEAEPQETAARGRWPQLSESDAERYIRERDAYLHRTALGTMQCTACVAPMMFFGAIGSMFTGSAQNAFMLLGVAGMFAMIGMGVYTMVTAVKPRDDKRMKRGRFALSARLCRRLESLREAAEEKARRRVGKGVALIVMSLIPMLAGAALSEIWVTNMDGCALFGLTGMFVMIGAGVYELAMADGEKKTVKRLLSPKA